jgi:Helix-turn-helix domain
LAALSFGRSRGDPGHEDRMNKLAQKISSLGSERSPLDEPVQASPKLLVREAAEFLRCSTSFLNKKRITGDGPPFSKVGKKILYDQKDLEDWLLSTKRRRTA